MLLSFSANTVAPEILEKTLIGRKEVVNQVEQELLEKILQSQTYQSLLIAPRGSGKTHITKVLHHRLKKNEQLADKILMAYMNEDERGIANFSDFIRHVLQSFIKHQEGNYEILSDSIYEISGLPINKQETAFENVLLEFIGKKSAVLLIENLNILFDKKTGMGPNGQKKLRSLMHEYNQFSIMATSQSLFYHIQDANGSFYNFFNIRHLEKLNFKQAFQFIKIQANLENSELLEEEIEKPIFKGKVRAIYQLTGGNHRLLVIFFNFLKTNIKSDLSKIFVKTMNDLKPYYEQFLNALSPQQQKVIQFLSSNHTPQMGKDISRFCFIAPTTLSKQTSELVDKGHLDKNKVGKDTYYELKEPLMRICFEINESSEGIAKLFIDFLTVLYSEEDLQKIYLKFKLGATLQKGELQSKYIEESKFYGKAIDEHFLETLDSINISSFKNEDELIKKIDSTLLKNKEKTQKNNLKRQIIESINQSFSIEHSQKGSLINGLDDFSIEMIERLIIFYQDENKKIKEKLGKNLYGRLLKEKRVDKKELYTDLGFFYKLTEKSEFINDPFLYNHIAKILANDGSHKKAIKYYKIALSIDSNLIETYLLLGWSLDKLHDYKAAINAYNQVIDLNPEYLNIYFHKGTALDNLEKLEEAMKCYKKAIELNTNDSHIFNNMGLVYIKQKNFKKGIEAYLQAIKLNDKDSTIHFNLGLAYNEVGNFIKAIEAFNNSISINPNDTAPHLYKGFSFVGLRKFEESINAFNMAIEINPNYLTAHLNKAQSFKYLNRFQNALESYKIVIQLEPDNLYYISLMANILSRLGQYKNAINNYNKVIQGNPENVDILYQRGCTYAEMGKFQLALSDFEKVLNLDAKHIETIHTKGRIYAALAKHHTAFEIFNSILNKKSNDAEFLNDLGMSLNMIEKYDQALKFIQKGLKINSKNWFLNGTLIHTYLSINSLKESFHQFEKIIGLGTPNITEFSVWLEQDNLYPLLKTTNLDVAKPYFQFLIKKLKENQLLPELWKAFPKAIFNMLINIEDYPKERLAQLNTYLQKTFKPYKEMTISLLYLDIGIRYLKKGEERAIYDFSKEERQIFQEFVLDKRASNSAQ